MEDKDGEQRDLANTVVRLRLIREMEEEKQLNAYLEGAYQERTASEHDGDDSRIRQRALNATRETSALKCQDSAINSPTDLTAKLKEALKQEGQAQRQKRRRKKIKSFQSKTITNSGTSSCQSHSKDDTTQAPKSRR